MSAYDPAKFAAVLKKAIGDRAVYQFAKEAGMSRFQVSRRLSCQLDTPPRKKTLSLIASVAQNNVTYDQLLLSCGYEPVTETKAGSRTYANEVRLSRACVLSGISEAGISCTVSAGSFQVPCDFEIMLDTSPRILWDFACIPSDLDTVTAEQVLHKNYLSLMFKRLAPYSKMSFVTDREDIFKLCADKKPVNLKANVSVILCSADTLDVICEQDVAVSDTSPLLRRVFPYRDGSGSMDR